MNGPSHVAPIQVEATKSDEQLLDELFPKDLILDEEILQSILAEVESEVTLATPEPQDHVYCTPPSTDLNTRGQIRTIPAVKIEEPTEVTEEEIEMDPVYDFVFTEDNDQQHLKPMKSPISDTSSGYESYPDSPHLKPDDPIDDASLCVKDGSDSISMTLTEMFPELF